MPSARRSGISRAAANPTTAPAANPTPMSCTTNVHHVKSPSSGSSAKQEREDGRQREAVVQPRLEVERVAYAPRHARDS